MAAPSLSAGLARSDPKSIETAISAHGWCHVRCDSVLAAEHLLLAVQERLGTIIRHDRSRADGLVPVQFNPEIDESQRLISETASDATPHMDGSFMEEPPAIVALAVIELSPDAPQTYGIDFGDILLRLSDRAILRHAQQDVARVRRLDRDTTFTPFMFEGGRVQVRYRLDDKVDVSSETCATPLFREIEDLVLAAPTSTYDLAPGSVIFFDNQRMLHGRQQFDPSRERRLLLRAWYPGPKTPSCPALGVPWLGRRPASESSVPVFHLEDRHQTVHVQNGVIAIEAMAKDGLAGVALDRTIFAIKQAIGLRYSPPSWTVETGRSGVRLAPVMAAKVPDGQLAAALARDLQGLIEGSIRLDLQTAAG